MNAIRIANMSTHPICVVVVSGPDGTPRTLILQGSGRCRVCVFGSEETTDYADLSEGHYVATLPAGECNVEIKDWRS